MGNWVEIFEVGPRDGLQNEARQVPTVEKIALVNVLSQAGFSRIECASFVSPKWVPQMADSLEVMGGITRVPGIRYAALTPNLKGFERAVSAGADEVAVFAAASEAFSKANINATIDESLTRLRPIVTAATSAGIPVRGYVSTVITCPYSGYVDPEDVTRVVKSLFDIGCYEISLGDTTGQGTPDTVAEMLDSVLEHVPAGKLAGHYHDTNGQALRSIDISLDRGLRVFDAAVGGLGGCPYSPGSTGNVATEAVADRLNALGLHHGLDTSFLAQAADMARAMRTG
ncbi:MAG: hydroxymethylglutaryl-CoA lyase [Marinovum sp.]|nr:hydroxymethylglutaryl-CoA lyase [Marinovum sp.]